MLSVLLVDDDPHDNFFHERAIAKSGLNCHVSVCASGFEALDLLQGKGNYSQPDEAHFPPDLIFLDINMPKLNGWKFLDAYAQLPENVVQKSSVIIIMLSTSPSPHTLEQALSNPYVADFVEKPLRPDAFKALIEDNPDRWSA